MKLKDAVSTIINILSAVLILLAVLVTILIFMTNNRYSEPVIGNTMLLCVREDSAADAKVGALAVVDLTTYTSDNGNYVAFVGRGARITNDPMACVGTVKYYIPVLGGVMDFFRNTLGFFFVIVLPLVALAIWHIVRIVILVKYGDNEQAPASIADCDSRQPGEGGGQTGLNNTGAAGADTGSKGG